MASLANNILSIAYQGDASVYVVIRDLTTGYAWNGSAFESFDASHLATYAIALAAQGGDLYTAALPSGIPAATLQLYFYEQAGNDPADSDLILSSPIYTWNGIAAYQPPPSGAPSSSPLQQLSKWQYTSAPARFITADQFARHIGLDRDGSNAPNSGGPSDDELLSYVHAAVDYVENAMEASLAPRTIRATFHSCRDMVLPRGPVIGITSIVDATATAITDFTTEAVGRMVRVKVRHARAPISITYTAGHTNVAIDGDGQTPVIPASIVLVILNYAAMLYANREAATDKPVTMLPHVEAFLRVRRRGTGVG